MCYHSRQSKTALELKQRFKANFEKEDTFKPEVYNGFEHPKTPVITNASPQTIQLFNWGLIPQWAKDDGIKKFTLNAKIETLHEKPSFRDAVTNRCLVLVDGFYEWKWLDAKGKQKQKYLITLPNNEAFAFAGIYSAWTDKSSGEVVNTYSILTTVANEFMSEVNNIKLRMPIVLNKTDESAWLSGQLNVFTDIDLVAKEV